MGLNLKYCICLILIICAAGAYEISRDEVHGEVYFVEPTSGQLVSLFLLINVPYHQIIRRYCFAENIEHASCDTLLWSIENAKPEVYYIIQLIAATKICNLTFYS